MKKVLHKILLGSIMPVLLLIFWESSAIRLNNPALLPQIKPVVLILLNPFSELIGTGSLFGT